MTTKTTVAIDNELRKIIKKLAALLDIPQGEVIKRAIAEYEKLIINKNSQLASNKENVVGEIEAILKTATDSVWKEDIKTKEIQEKLKKGTETIDDIILNNWESGLNL